VQPGAPVERHRQALEHVEHASLRGSHLSPFRLIGVDPIVVPDD
jgi:hypothetical protein